jgi:hypothetical protein
VPRPAGESAADQAVRQDTRRMAAVESMREGPGSRRVPYAVGRRRRVRVAHRRVGEALGNRCRFDLMALRGIVWVISCP